MKPTLRKGLCFLLGMVAVLALAGGSLAKAATAANESCSSLYGARVCTSYQMQSGKITELTLRVPVAMVEKAPADAPMVWPPKPDLTVPFAAEVQKQIGFTYATIYWNPHGHEPAVFAVPHFDFHFYFAPQREIETVDCKNPLKPKALPADYAMGDVDMPGLGKLVGSCIPGMGMHAAPAADLASKNWKGSMIVGYYNGEPIFFEPMITSALLLQKRSFSMPVPQDVASAAHVRYPKRFRAVYLAKQKVYDFTFFY